MTMILFYRHLLSIYRHLLILNPMYNPKISVFRSLFNSKETPFTLTAIEVYNRIKSGSPELINKIKKIREGDSESKMQLMAIMFNGTFSERKDDGLIQHSGLCVIDFDKYPDKATMESERKKLIECPYVYMMFTSPSGNGLKAVIRIPESDKFEHKRRFEAFKEYIQSNYFDSANGNVSRVCFESYDQDAYLNEFCDVFTDITQDKGYHKAEKIAVLPIANEDKIIELVMKFNHGRFEDGRNNWTFKVACCLCEYGVDQYAAKQYLLQYEQDDFTANEINNTISNAYKSSNFNTRYFEDSYTMNKVKLKLKEGISEEDIQNQLGVNGKIIESVKNEVQDTDDVFWQEDGKKVTIMPHDYAKFLQKHGFAKYYPERSNKPTYVYIEENKVSESSVELIKDFVLKYLLKKDELNVYNHCAKSANLFTESHLNMLESIDMRILQDDRYSSYIPFLNGVVKVTKDKVKLLSYIDIDGYIWKEQIIRRNYTQIAIHDNNFQDFVHKVSAQDQDRIKAMESTLGYLIHTFKDKTDQKAIIFNDQEINDNPNGGSGKSLMLTAIGNIRKIIKIDGKAYNPSKNDFVYQRVNMDTQVLAFDDVKKHFDFEQLFSLITEGIPVNRKNKDEIYIPFERSPKIVITTNYVIAGAGTSHDRRRHEIEFFQYFNSQRNPQDEYGKLLFDEWTNEEWSNFDNYMLSNLQMYLQNGLIKSKSINADAKRFIQNTCKEFYDFVMDGNVPLNVRLYNKTSMEAFQSDTNGFKDLDSRKYIKWVQSYASYKGYKFTKNRDQHGRYFELTDEQ
jgi:hypothetical protein